MTLNLARNLARPTLLALGLTTALTVGLVLPAAAQDVTSDTVVARVGETEITMGHVIMVRRALPQQYVDLPDEVLFPGIVDQLVDQLLLSLKLEGDLPAALALRMENEQRAMIASATLSQLTENVPTEEALQAAYDAAYAALPAEVEYNASHILVETEEEAAELVTSLEGGADFATLAAEKSTGPSGPSGGLLGWFGPGMMVPEFEAAVVQLEPGTISAPVKTQFGWHVVRLNETRDVPPPSLEEVRDELSNTLRQQAVEAAVAGLREGTDTEVLIDGIALDAFRDDSLLAN